MTEVDGQSNAASPAAENEDVIELEPTRAQMEPLPASAEPSFHMALVAGSLPSISRDNEILLRSRLKAAVLFLLVAYSLFFIIGLVDSHSLIARVLVFFGIRVVLCGALFGLLVSPVAVGYQRLRMLEYLFFGALTLLMIGAQYVACSGLIREGDFPNLIVAEKNAVLNYVVVMVIYGVFIPNKPSMTARMVLTMSLGPLLVLTLLEIQADEASMMNKLATTELTVANSLFILVGASLAIYTSYVLNGLRQELREARRLGHYQLGEKLGEGGMGKVYLAEHKLLKRPCALKLIKADVNTNPIAVARFEREVQIGRDALASQHDRDLRLWPLG